MFSQEFFKTKILYKETQKTRYFHNVKKKFLKYKKSRLHFS